MCHHIFAHFLRNPNKRLFLNFVKMLRPLFYTFWHNLLLKYSMRFVCKRSIKHMRKRQNFTKLLRNNVVLLKLFILGNKEDLFTHFSKILEKSLARFFRKISKTSKTCFFLRKKSGFREIGAKRPFFKSYWTPLSCKISEKSLERFPSNSRYPRTHARTHPQG